MFTVLYQEKPIDQYSKKIGLVLVLCGNEKDPRDMHLYELGKGTLMKLNPESKFEEKQFPTLGEAPDVL